MKQPAALALIVSLVAPAAFAAPSKDFDAAMDVSAALASARAAAAEVSAPVRTQTVGRFEVDCVDVSFNASDAAASEYIPLRSQEWETVCTPVGDPRRGGGQNCWERPGFSYTRTVRVERVGVKPLLPWEHDTFRVCLQGPWLDSRPQATAYKYRLVDDGRSGNIAYEAGDKVATRPDPAGLSIAGLTSGLTLTLTDKWASYYSGEAVKIHVQIKKDSLFHPTVSEFDLMMPTAAAYTLDLARQAGTAVQNGKGYFARVSFQRAGKVSNADSVKAGDTATVKYQPSAAGIGR